MNERVLDEARCRYCGFWHVIKARLCCPAATKIAEKELKEEFEKRVDMIFQGQRHVNIGFEL